MAKFFTGNELNTAIEALFEDAQEQLILISTYIKLHDRFVSVLKTKKDNPKFKITIVFGKNDEDYSKSLRSEDFSFFKEFPNVEIRYEKRLHAKYYANESKAIITSMNLYSYSQDNNIEAGVLMVRNLLGSIASSLMDEETIDKTSSKYFERVIEQSDCLFKKVPHYESANLGFSKKYKESIIEIDKLGEHFEGKQGASKFKGNSVKTTNNNSTFASTEPTGYCIRTGIQIPFNVEKPLSNDAYKAWSKTNNKDLPEKFCHFSGEPSNGETTVSKPILKKNWKLAKETFSV